MKKTHVSSVEEILERLVDKPPTTLETGCREWPHDDDGAGYRRAVLNGRRERVHVIVYRALFGEIPEGMEVHHRCENRACANPEHLQMLTPAQHGYAHRKTHCPNGHPYAENARAKSNGYSDCQICHREREYRRFLAQSAERVYIKGPYKRNRSRKPWAKA